MEQEIWADVPWYENYKISNIGRAKSIRTGKDYILTPFENGQWYLIIKPSKKNLRMHRLVATLFIDNPHWYKTVNHKNWNKKDNRAVNLEWCTLSQNIKHAWDNWMKENTRRRLIEFNKIAKRDERWWICKQ
jgi:hypothetical protein